MAEFTSQGGILRGQDVVSILFPVAVIPLLFLLRSVFFYVKARSQFPGPPIRNFWVGNLDQTMANDVHEKWLQWNREYGPIFQTWNSPFSRVIYIGDPHIITEITTLNWPKSSAQYAGFRPLSGDALFVQTNHEKWRIQSKRLAPAFQPHVIQAQRPCLAKHLSNFVRAMDVVAEQNTVVDLSSLHILLTLDFVGDIAFGTNLHAISQGRDCRILQLFEIILPELMKCGLFPLRGRFPILQKTRLMYRAIAELRSMAEKAIKDARQKGDEALGTSPRKKISDILATQREPDESYTFSSKELCDNYIAFLVAGGDPTAHTMSFLIYQVLCHPLVLKKVRAEIDANIPFDTTVPSISQVNLPYLNMVIKETLRYSSPGFGTFRVCPVDTTIAGVTLPANTTLALWNPAVHRDPKLWDNADEFDPERWQSGQPKVRGSYFPFSSGPRSCIGQGLAMLEMTMTLATVFRRYDLSLESGFQMEYLPSFTLKPKNGLLVRAILRKF
ncbi:cytochrome P450 46A1 [Hypoxylon rubiginosum]|uniref:Cytochrome P450 46A1 n=1 Tax=Hypoxylon rubiginosum TaxID=110542 RepID=A0ACC0D7P1_9PEZI|nr:cytochrome P450 46A1 [Hypoxylon rubiginosum]